MNKKILAVHQQQHILLSLEMVLTNWGYHVETATSVRQMNARLRKLKPQFLLLGNGLITPEQLENLPLLLRQTKANDIPIALLGEAKCDDNIPARFTFRLPLNIFALYEALQQSLEPIPRQDVRVKVQLPGMVRPGDKHFNLSEVLCLSTGGMFIRCGTSLPTATRLEIILPLLGLKRELEISGEVIYQVTPSTENNYSQGVGIRFSNLSGDEKNLLENYLENRLQEDLSKCLGHELDRNTPLFVWDPESELDYQSA